MPVYELTGVTVSAVSGSAWLCLAVVSRRRASAVTTGAGRARIAPIRATALRPWTNAVRSRCSRAERAAAGACAVIAWAPPPVSCWAGARGAGGGPGRPGSGHGCHESRKDCDADGVAELLEGGECACGHAGAAMRDGFDRERGGGREDHAHAETADEQPGDDAAAGGGRGQAGLGQGGRGAQQKGYG